jgi:hypothetical protein
MLSPDPDSKPPFLGDLKPTMATGKEKKRLLLPASVLSA